MLSIVIPALNESVTIGEFIDWCKQGLADAKVAGEILIIDSSTDGTAELAVAKGARVLRVPRRGLGRRVHSTPCRLFADGMSSWGTATALTTSVS